MKPLEDGLEAMIERGLPAEDGPVGAVLQSNAAARQEVTDMIEISRQIRDSFQLSASEADALEVSPGFYARVLARIEAERATPSIWNFFLEPMGRRLVYASLTLAGLLFAATFFDSTPSGQLDSAANDSGPAVHGAVLASSPDEMPIVESSNADEDRGTALVQLTTYSQ